MTVQFAPAATFAGNGNAQSVALGDVLGNGKLDLVIFGDTARVFMGDGKGNFALPIDVGQPFFFRNAKLVDVNGDGKADLVAGYADASGNLGIAVRPADGASDVFGPQTLYSTGTAYYTGDLFAVGDVTGDGKPDLVATTNTGAITLAGDGKGGFGTPMSSIGTPGIGALASLRANGILDLISPTNDGVTVRQGDGKGGFGPAATYKTNAYNNTGVAVGDLLGNGKQDLVVADQASNMVTLLLGDGKGGVGAPINLPAGGNPLAVAIADMNGDGIPDIVVANGYRTPGVSVLLGDGKGGFSAPITTAVGDYPTTLAVADLNGDGKMDVVVNNSGAHGATVLLNTTPTPASAVTAGVDVGYYRNINADVLASGIPAATHYHLFGWKEGRNPNAVFNTSYYLAQNPDVKAAGLDPLAHYEAYGWKEGRNPSAAFNTASYLALNPDVKAAGLNPLDHYLAFGAAEGRRIS